MCIVSCAGEGEQSCHCHSGSNERLHCSSPLPSTEECCFNLAEEVESKEDMPGAKDCILAAEECSSGNSAMVLPEKTAQAVQGCCCSAEER